VPEPRATPLERALHLVHRWVWRDARRRGRKLLTFAATEASGARDLSRAAELTRDPVLRGLFLRHALDEQQHAELFRARGRAILAGLGPADATGFEANWVAPGERGLDEVRVDGRDAPLLAFLHLSEQAAAARFAAYREAIADEATRDVFGTVLHDEVFHMRYTRAQLARVAPRSQGVQLWRARLARTWRAWLRLATVVSGLLGTVVLLAQYFLVVPFFALLARRAARRERPGFSEPVQRHGRTALESQY
jgi:rubrerythrin